MGSIPIQGSIALVAQLVEHLSKKDFIRQFLSIFKKVNIMIESIKIGKEKERIKNKYVFHIKVMHGDADLNEVHTVKLDNEETALEYWNLFSFWFDLGFNKCYGADDDEIMEAFSNRAMELGIKGDVSDTYFEVVGNDITSGGNYYARPEGMWLTYFDENGIEYEIDEPKKLGY